MKSNYRQLFVALGCWGLAWAAASSACGDDWPMWRRDAARSAKSAETLPVPLQQRWVRQLPKLKPAYREARLQFDAGYEPVVLGKTMFVASSQADRVIALATENGRQRWEFYAEGPIRCAPAAWRDRVFFGSDDGCLYCLDADSGKLQWKFRAAPSQRKLMGNGRMISLWPIRGGPAVHEGKVYFAAGVWSFEGVFVYCLDARTGKVVWRSDDGSFVYGTHPHGAKSMGGITPQGYLVVAGDDLVVPCGQAMPARFDLRTGKLKSFELPAPGRRPGGWFVASAAVRRGEVTLDAEINRDLHEDKVYQGPGSPGVRSTISVAGKSYKFGDGFPGVKSKIHTMLAADGKMFVVDVDGRIHCFGEKPERVIRHGLDQRETRGGSGGNQQIQRILSKTKTKRGHVLVRGASFGAEEGITGAVEALLRHSELHLVVTDSNTRRLDGLRGTHRLERERICLLSKPNDGRLELPRYFASLLISNSRQAPDRKELELLRPHGGVACFPLSDEAHLELRNRLDGSDKREFSIERTADLTFVRRGALIGAANYTGGWFSPDERVRAPLGVLWFADTLGHFKRSPQPWFVDGVMISYPKDWMEIHRANRKPPYKLLPPVFSDVYTGRVLAADEPIVSALKFPPRDLKAKQPNQYRPPTQRNAWKPKQPVIGERINPLTGEKEPRSIPKSYGCDGGVDYGNVFTMRSGTPAFYDKVLESGVCNISGPRSGCTNSLIPAGGVLNVPYFYEGCTCSYPMPVGLALISMPPEHEQWASWGPGKAESMQRVGVNFGAPGDRMSPAGTLWLDYPNRGGPSPSLAVSIEPASAEFFYRHSLFQRGGPGWPWVAASGVSGARTIVIEGFKPADYVVRLQFAAPADGGFGPTRFDVSLNDQTEVETIDLTKAATRSTIRQFQRVKIDNKLRIVLKPLKGRTILCGVEVVRAGLELDRH